MLHRRRNLLFFGNLAEKASCVDDKTVLFRYTYIHKLFFSNLSQIRITTYHLKKDQNPYWIRTIRTRWHVCIDLRILLGPRPWTSPIIIITVSESLVIACTLAMSIIYTYFSITFFYLQFILFLGKVRWENSVGKCGGKVHGESSVGKFGGNVRLESSAGKIGRKVPWKCSVGKFGGKFRRGGGKFWGKFWWESLAVWFIYFIVLMSLQLY